MKLTVLITFLFSSTSFGQSIVGTWQARDTIVGSMYQERYVFGADKKFVYYPSEYDGLQRIMSIGGRYHVAVNAIYMTLEYSVEQRGEAFERSHFTTLNNSWSLTGGHSKICKIAKPVQQMARFKLIQHKKGRCLLLDSQPYYKLRASAD